MKLCMAESIETPPTHCCARCGEPGAAIEWRTRWWCDSCHVWQELDSAGKELAATGMVWRSERRIKVAKGDDNDV